jgi:nicotinamide-nucleotide amidase
LLGDIVNSNAAVLGRFLADAGIDCLRHVSVGDNEQRIAATIRAVLDEADGVIVTGGLGPTQDDVTREAVCIVVGREMVRDASMEDAIRSRFALLRRQMPAINLRQADRPDGSVPIPPVIGTAPGLIVEHEGKVLYLIPGVPSEMKEMMTRAVLPDLALRGGAPAAIVSRVVRAVGVAESFVAEALAPAWTSMQSQPVTMAFLAGGGEVRVRLTAKAASRADAVSLLDDAEAVVRSALGFAIVGVDAETLETVVLSLVSARGWRVACAESLTGGLLGARITEVPGASASFVGSIVAYDGDAKRSLLGVSSSVLSLDGVVSAACAVEMARGARERFGVELALATTGVAGPEPHGGHDVGTVFVAVSGPLGDVSREVHLPGDRETIRRMATAAALNLARLYLLEALP